MVSWMCRGSQKKTTERAFTLVELLIVVALIGILSAVSVVSYQGYAWSSKKKAIELSLNGILLAEEEYKSDNGNYYISSGCSNTSYKGIRDELLDGKESLEKDDWQFCTEKRTVDDTLNIKAVSLDRDNCTLILTETMDFKAEGSDC